MPRYTVTFERIGRNKSVPPLNVKAADADHLARFILKYAREHLRSRNVEVIVGDDGKGFIACGFHSGGDFTVETR